MSIMAKTPSGYKKIGSAYLGERPVDKVFNANGDVVYALQRELTGVPPLLFKGKEQSELLNYRIYGDTIDGESVGDRTANLFDGAVEQGSFNTETGGETVLNIRVRSKSITLGDGNYTISAVGVDAAIVMVYLTDGTYTKLESIVSYNNLPFSFSLDAERIIRFAFKKNDNSGILPSDISNIMLNAGSTPLPYEPYGYKVPVTVEGKNLFDINNLEDYYDISIETGLPTRGSAYSHIRCAITTPIKVSAGDYYLTFNKNIADEIGFIVSVFENNTLISRTSGYYSGARIQISSGNNIYIGFYNQNVSAPIHPSDISNIMLNSGSTALPVTTPIYLPEPIKMVGDEAEYIDYGEQKQHFADGTETAVTLPSLPIIKGTNTMIIDTEVQPSRMDIKGRIKSLT